MADLENLLLEAAGRTSSSGRKKNHSHSQMKRKEGSYSDDESDSKGDDSDNPDFSRRKHTQIPLKKRHDATEDDDDGSSDEDERHYGGGDESDSVGSIGSDLYKDDADREKLSKMSEFDREYILSERAVKRDDYKWKRERGIKHNEKEVQSQKKIPPPLPSRGRSSTKSERTSAKTDALNELRVRRMNKPQDFRGNGKLSSPLRPKVGSRASPSSGSSRSESGSESESGDEGSAEGGDLGESDEDGLSSGKDMPTFDDIKQITIRRSKLAKWFMEPFFEDIIVGCFVRVGIGMSRAGQSIYRLCMVRNVDASNPDRLYKLENKTTHKYLNCIWGNENSSARWQMIRVSDSPPLEREFDELVREVERVGGQMPSRQDVEEKKEAIRKINNFVYSAATVKQMLQDKKSASVRPLNIAAEKDRLRKEMDVAESRHDSVEVDRIRSRLQELETLSLKSKAVDPKAVRLAEMNRRNRAENFKNASELKPVNTSLKAGEAGYDPFSRRWTRSSNYFAPKSSNQTTENASTTVADTGIRRSIEVTTHSENGEAATAAALEAAADAGKLVDTSAPVDQGTESNSLHDFELPISLANLQKFGGPQGAHLGFMARKQKMETTIGFKVPENDGRRHPLTLTVSDYKRRRGLL